MGKVQGEPAGRVRSTGSLAIFGTFLLDLDDVLLATNGSSVPRFRAFARRLGLLSIAAPFFPPRLPLFAPYWTYSALLIAIKMDLITIIPSTAAVPVDKQFRSHRQCGFSKPKPGRDEELWFDKSQ